MTHPETAKRNAATIVRRILIDFGTKLGATKKSRRVVLRRECDEEWLEGRSADGHSLYMPCSFLNYTNPTNTQLTPCYICLSNFLVFSLHVGGAGILLRSSPLSLAVRWMASGFT